MPTGKNKDQCNDPLDLDLSLCTLDASVLGCLNIIVFGII